MTRAEWESLCDGCGRCCLHKLRDEDTDALAFTNVACRLLDTDSCRCARLREPQAPRAGLREADAAAHRRASTGCRRPAPIAWWREGQDLAWWHPLVSGAPETVHEAGVSVRGRAVREREAGAFEDHIVTWPGRWPAPAHAHHRNDKEATADEERALWRRERRGADAR